MLLKSMTFEAVECQADDVFLVARIRAAGICGVFDSMREAEAFMNRHRLPETTVIPPRHTTA